MQEQTESEAGAREGEPVCANKREGRARGRRGGGGNPCRFISGAFFSGMEKSRPSVGKEDGRDVTQIFKTSAILCFLVLVHFFLFLFFTFGSLSAAVS